MNIQFIDRISGPSLVAVREFFEKATSLKKNIIFATISPNANTKIPITRKWNRRKIRAKVPYGKLPQKVQYNYCIRMLKSSYNYSNTTQIFGTWELNKQGNVHLHILMVDDYIQNHTTLQMFRRDVLNSELVIKNLSKSMIDYCNNIVFVTDSINDRLNYLTKDVTDNNNILPYFYCLPFKLVETGMVKESDTPLGEVPLGTLANPPIKSDIFDAVYLSEIDAIVYKQNVYKKGFLC